MSQHGVVKIAFFGLPLGALLLARDGHELALCTLAPVAAPGARRLVRQLGSDRVLDARTLGAALDEAVERRLGAVDLVVSWFWTRRLPERWLTRARLGGVGVHPSLLPRHRGPNPFFWAIDAGDALTGVAVHRLTAEYDTGDVLERLAISVGETNSWQLARALDRPSLCALRAVVARIAAGGPLPAEPQDERAATWAPEPEGDALRADFHWTTARVLRRVRALAPVPGLALELHGVPFFVTAASSAACPEPLEPGEAAILGEPPRDVVIRTSDGAIRIDAVALGDVDGAEGLEMGGEQFARFVAFRRTTVID